MRACAYACPCVRAGAGAGKWCMCVHVNVHAFMNVCMCAITRERMRVRHPKVLDCCVHVYEGMHAVRASVHAWIYACVRACMRAYAHTCMSVCMRTAPAHSTTSFSQSAVRMPAESEPIAFDPYPVCVRVRACVRSCVRACAKYAHVRARLPAKYRTPTALGSSSHDPAATAILII